ncbi:MAG: hypothetical protein IT379_18985 [Deltaproteobacteria bacterium]|nr:hypothetical protein [Deltaproteobacteria bacterium]
MLTGRQTAGLTVVLGIAGVALPIVAARAYDQHRAWMVASRAAALAWDGWAFRIAAACFALSLVLVVVTSVIERLSASNERRARSRRTSTAPPARSATPPVSAPKGGGSPSRGAARPLTIDAPTIDNLGLTPTGRRRLEELLAEKNGVVLVVCRDRLLGTQAARVIDGLRPAGRAMVVLAEEEAVRSAVAGAAARVVVVAVHGRSAESVIRELRERTPVLATATRGVVEVCMFPRLCGMCTHPRPIDPSLAARALKLGLDLSDRVAYRGQGCDVCKGSGHRGGAYVSVVSPPEDAVASMNRAEALGEWIEKGWLGVDDVVEGLTAGADDGPPTDARARP